ncbi:MAG: hypothetical protein ACI4UH_07390 [Dorea sp.]
MLDKQKVKLMTRLAFYEQTQGKEDFKVSEYYKKDYVGFHTLSTILWVTIGYACLAFIIVLGGLEALMAKMSMASLVTLVAVFVIGYVVSLIVFGIIASHVYNEKHKKARQRVKKFNHDLIRLLKMYEKENK